MNQKKKVPGLIALKQIIETTSAYTGDEFFKSLVQHLAAVLDVYGVWITELWPEENKLNALAFWLDGAHVDQYTYRIENTPCEPVLQTHQICHISNNVIELYPNDPDLKPMGAVSYMGLSLRDTDDRVIGHLAMLDNKPMPEIPEAFAIFKIFASRAAAELRRVIAQRKISESESKLKRLVNGTSDAIIEFDSSFRITQANLAAHGLFGYASGQIIGKHLKQMLDIESYKLINTILPGDLVLNDELRSLRLKDTLTCLKIDGESFPAEANLSQYESDDRIYFVLYIRSIKDQLLDKLEIQTLRVESSVLKEKVHEHEFNYIIGNSRAIKECVSQVHQVGPTDANVLIQGETGTGKELFARAVHQASNRHGRPMITLNCAALPAELIESELFGHVKGAFTGAVSTREGRFSLADKSTLFLDEIGELPLALQAKLLRVLQEGSFEPVGSSETRKVDVRIVAATHRNLKKSIEEGKFREDLFYRLNVFPIHIPPLRERGKDIELLASAFFKKFAKNRAVSKDPFSESDLARLSNYHWPGNVRELQNIVERYIIIGRNGHPDLEGMLPKKSPSQDGHAETTHEGILTMDEMNKLEKNNIIKALNMTHWRISGEGGAAELLGIPRTTLASKIKKFGISKIAQ
ncbi:sigma 54-interacting transcriptional regulator [Robiginitalea sp. SC105]|uniref:sigma 54-interacting transcriptional regulator n=1 Tax=Robiginitalea sp. SC105 TaxID=2762332 RepID=UPI001639FB25|nr:sigma 54-interacting transcriptional regulator [Robiginitalea sp. SC105]MBC2838621.1 sigma 54-interacting transcriptional regulator [Robiginitalea sp. SC105]